LIPFAFEYHRADSLEEAALVYQQIQASGQKPIYYGGGTEILTMARLAQIHFDAVIDIKQIPQCQRLERADDAIVFGAGVSLDRIGQANLWPLLSQAGARVADHSVRCKITLGGNLAGTLPYREVALPFMLFSSDAHGLVFGPGGSRDVPFKELFNGQLNLRPGEFLVELRVAQFAAEVPALSVKKTRLDWVDYPLFTVAMVRINSEIRVAFSGVTGCPFTSDAINRTLNAAASGDDRARSAVAHISDSVVDDLHGSAKYRRFLLTRTLADMLAKIEE